MKQHPSSAPLCFQNKDLQIEIHCHGAAEYTKISYPIKYGIFSRLQTADHVFEFNLNHEIRHAKARTKTWLHPSEWLKRTMGNDWIYYSSGGYSGVYEALGEYYLPNVTYATNSLLGGKPFLEPDINAIVSNWYEMICQVPKTGLPEPFSEWLKAVKRQTPQALDKKAGHLFDISGSRVTVMPPDARHVDYNIIPLTIADGCLYKCRFCKVKNKNRFSVRSRQDIDRQIQELKQLYQADIINYNALFLGEHDSFAAPADVILDTARSAYDAFGFADSYMKDAFLFLFASVDSFMGADDRLFDRMAALPFKTFINIGLESNDAATLSLLGKPISPDQVTRAFSRIQTLNDQYPAIELTCNFIMDETLPPTHYPSVMKLIRESQNRVRPKGCVYFSPLTFGQPSRRLLYEFYHLKSLSRLPTFLYLIQRL